MGRTVVGGAPSFFSLSLRQITRPAPRVPLSPSPELLHAFSVRPGALPAPPLRLQWRENSEPRTRGRSPGGRGGRGAGAECPAVGAGAAGLLPSPAVGARNPAGRRRPADAETPLGWLYRPVEPRPPRRSGSLGRLRLVRGRVRARAVALPCCGSMPLHRTPSWRPQPTRWRPGQRSCGSVQGARAARPTAGGYLRALSAGVTGPLSRGKLAPVSAGLLPRAALAARLANPGSGCGTRRPAPNGPLGFDEGLGGYKGRGVRLGSGIGLLSPV